MTAAPEPPAPEPAADPDDRRQEGNLHPRDNRVLRDHHGNPLPGSEDPPDVEDDPQTSS
jgi:hypothetical protein